MRSAGWQDVIYLLPHCPGPLARTEQERAAREQTVMCNQAAGLSGCLTKSTGCDDYTTVCTWIRGRASPLKERSKLWTNWSILTFNHSISQAMARTKQDLFEDIFISVANFTLAPRDSYLEYLYASVKQDTLTAMCTAVHLHSLFPDQLPIKAEEEVSRSEERCSSSQSHRKPSRFHP